MGAMASQITSLIVVYSAVYWGAEQRKYQSSASLAFVRGIHRGPVNSPSKGPVTRKIFPFDDVIMVRYAYASLHASFWQHGCDSCDRETRSCVLLTYMHHIVQWKVTSLCTFVSLPSDIGHMLPTFCGVQLCRKLFFWWCLSEQSVELLRSWGAMVLMWRHDYLITQFACADNNLANLQRHIADDVLVYYKLWCLLTWFWFC